MRRIAVLAVGLVACASSPAFRRVSSAPTLPPSENVVVVDRPPAGGVLLGTAEIQLTVFQLPSECAEAALAEARKAGANFVVMPPTSSGTATRGPHCSLQAYYVPSKR